MKRNIVVSLLRECADRIEDGSCTLSPAQVDAIISELNNEPLSKEQARIYLGMSRSNFDRLVREGVLPRGRKIQGITNLVWLKSDLRLRR